MSQTIILITGANSGIGYAAAKVITSASDKYHVIIGSRSAQNGEEAVKEIKQTGIKGNLSSIQLDVTSTESVNAAASFVKKEYGRVDVLINNAGIALGDDDIGNTLEATLRTNVIGAAVMTEAFKPLLFESKNPYLIYVSSGLGSCTMASDPSSPYSQSLWMTYRTSKAALNMVAICHANELRPKGVKVFPMCPGLVVSNLRGKEEDKRQAGGRAGDPEVSGATLLSIIEGKRDSEVGQFVHKDGTYAW